MDWNTNIIEEFRKNGGRVASFRTQPLLLLHHRGAKTGIERVNPLAYQELDEGYAVFASKGGAPRNPDWYHNLVANPDVTIEVGGAEAPKLGVRRLRTQDGPDHPRRRPRASHSARLM